MLANSSATKQLKANRNKTPTNDSECSSQNDWKSPITSCVNNLYIISRTKSRKNLLSLEFHGHLVVSAFCQLHHFAQFSSTHKKKLRNSRLIPNLLLTLNNIVIFNSKSLPSQALPWMTIRRDSRWFSAPRQWLQAPLPHHNPKLISSMFFR